ncbi:MAG: AraC family transcriptional regulator [Oscillospiraceae bacterium]
MINNTYNNINRINRPLSYGINVDLDYIEHSHINYELIFLCEGELIVIINGKQYLMEKNDFLFIPNRHIHSMYTPKHSKTISIAFIPEELPQFQRLMEEIQSHPILLAYKQQCTSLRRLAQTYASDCEAGDPLILVSYLGQFLGYIKSELVCIREEEPALSASLATFERALSFIHGRIQQRVTLEMTSDAIGITKFHLSRLFKTHLQLGFSGYVSLLRIYGAMRLLEETNQSMTQIAAYCGFDTMRSFNRSFLEFAETTPREFRARYIDSGLHEILLNAPWVRTHVRQQINTD